jgi:integrase
MGSTTGRGEGGVYQRADGQWVGTVSLGYDASGRRRRKTVYGPTKKDAQEKLRKAQSEHALGRMTDNDKLTVAAYLALWLQNVVRVKVSPSTYDRYRMVTSKQIEPHLGGVRLHKLTTYNVSQLDAALEKAGESPRMRQISLTVLYGALGDAVRKKLLASNLCTDATRPKAPKKEMRTWEREQVRQFLAAAASDRLFVLYVTAIETGMRQGELFGLHWPDIDFAVGTIQVQRSLSELRGVFALKSPKTEAGRRRIELSEFALDALNDHRKAMLTEGRDVRAGLVFCDEKGGFLRKSNVTRRSFRAAMKRANEIAEKEAARTGAASVVLPQIRFHDLRHSAASLLLMAGENIKVFSERLGHEDVRTTLTVYAHTLPTMQRSAAEKMNRIFNTPKAAES